MLGLRLASQVNPEHELPHTFCIIIQDFCHVVFVIGLLLAFQTTPLIGSPADSVQVRIPRINGPAANEILVRSVTQERDGPWYYLRGAVSLETTEFLLRADEVDYNEKTGYAEGRGRVKFQSFARGEDMEADRVEYFLKEEKGRFYNVRGTSPAKVNLRPGILQSNSPFIFQGKWAERLGDKYILYNGFVTDCRVPRPWWVLRGSKFDIVPGDRAVAYKSRYLFKGVPLLYAPVFYRPLSEEPRRSGFLTPNFGNSSRRGKMLGVGYYWAINRSYDLTYRSQLFTQRGFAHHFDFRGKPTKNGDFDAILYGVNDRGLQMEDGSRIKQGGFLLTVRGKLEFWKGFVGRAEVNYLSSFVFRQAFTESFNEAVFSEVQSRGFIGKHWSTYSLNLVFERVENYQSTDPGDRVVIRRLPSFEFMSRDRQVSHWKLPVWVSLESSAAFVRRNQPLFQTRQFVERLDFAPRVMTAFRWKEFTLLPSVSIRETHYGSSLQNGTLSGNGVMRSTRDFSAELIFPSLTRIFEKPPSWLGEKFKHVIEPRAGFRYTGGVKDFSEIIRFDETELITNTKEIDYSISNRFYTKRNGQVREFLTWQVWQKRYLDPDLGGAVVPGQRNVFWTQSEMTGYAFFDSSRRYSPIVSSARAYVTPTTNIEWRADYDPLRGRTTNSTVLFSWRNDKSFITGGHNYVRANPAVSPSSNQFIGLLGWGRSDRKGWSTGFQAIYDFRLGIMQFATTQVTYNTDCCGFSVQYRRFSFGTRNENQFRVAFAVANIGSFGTLRRQERVF